jgi:hypothetical protein
MSRPLPFTQASIARAIKGVEKAGRFVWGVKPDGTLIVGDKPLDAASNVPIDAQPSLPVETRRMAEYFNGGAGEA